MSIVKLISCMARADPFFRSVSATSRDFSSVQCGVSYARLTLSACSEKPLPEDLTPGLPSKQQAGELIQHYWNRVFTIFPLFDERRFFESYKAVYNSGPSTATCHDHYFIRMALALSSASHIRQPGDRYSMDAVGHVAVALSFAEQVFHPGSIENIQALVLLVQYSLVDPIHFDSWALIGAAVRATVDLGLHQEPSKPLRISKEQLDLRRRVFYCVYSLDR